jgi:type III secretory pathway lipoprotein EscJ
MDPLTQEISKNLPISVAVLTQLDDAHLTALAFKIKALIGASVDGHSLSSVRFRMNNFDQLLSVVPQIAAFPEVFRIKCVQRQKFTVGK